jgi:hypothetical protein
MTQVIATARGANVSHGITSEHDSTAIMMQVTANATGSGVKYAITNSSSSANLNNSTISATGAGSNYGIYNTATADAYTVTVNNSQITGSTNTIRNDTEFTVRVGASQLAGGAIVTGGVGKEICVGVYDENYASAGYTTCP